jgi:hypothetical protein
MKRIYWYNVPPDQPYFRLKLPGHPQMLSIQVVDGKPRLYALLAPELPELVHEFKVFSTGAELPDATGSYIGTFILPVKGKKPKTMPSTNNVGHVFIVSREVGKSKALEGFEPVKEVPYGT